ncbi:unnamed protein product [Dicrocoelium dendriticum]|nr:unnamed protein product [Dicrocoelium dendriticum]
MAADNGTPNLTKKGVGKFKCLREQDKSSPAQLPQSLSSQPMKPTKSREDDKNLVAGSGKLLDDPQLKVRLLDMIRQRIAILNAHTFYVRNLPRSTLVSLLRSLCPTSVNAHLNHLTFDRGCKSAFIVFKTETSTREAQNSIHLVNGHFEVTPP